MDQAITGAIYVTFDNEKNCLSIVQITHRFTFCSLRFCQEKTWKEIRFDKKKFSVVSNRSSEVFKLYEVQLGNKLE